MERSRTLWEEGREPAFQVVALGLAVALTAVVVDVWLFEDLGLLFDLCFVALCVVIALRVRPRDFFVVGVAPPLLMLGVFVLLGTTGPDTIAEAHDGTVQAVVSGLSTHSLALVVGYLLCLACLYVRQRVLAGQGQHTDLLGS
ncbi:MULTISPECIES: DUF6542 domain-containing protein [unclassified Nocardioides]|uniref:DUF6542 domain-containing protein n=1 Tax=unclassified Nocardioides TaxID=2615069 RepID=UPI0026662DF2|nr:DUF6542 domain-containing protein [Nocardioides sp. Arc9.136]WKN49487.1 hypothetical protein OSR43_04990 [Nocardioides sp. Arc9.136]